MYWKQKRKGHKHNHHSDFQSFNIDWLSHVNFFGSLQWKDGIERRKIEMRNNFLNLSNWPFAFYMCCMIIFFFFKSLFISFISDNAIIHLLGKPRKKMHLFTVAIPFLAFHIFLFIFVPPKITFTHFRYACSMLIASHGDKLWRTNNEKQKQYSL